MAKRVNFTKPPNPDRAQFQPTHSPAPQCILGQRRHTEFQHGILRRDSLPPNISKPYLSDIIQRIYFPMPSCERRIFTLIFVVVISKRVKSDILASQEIPGSYRLKSSVGGDTEIVWWWQHLRT